MSYAAALQNFAQQAARERAALYGGTLKTGTCAADGRNFSLGSVRFRAPFADEFGREITEFGEKAVTLGVLLVRDELNLSIELGSLLTHLASNTTWVVEEIKRPPASVERRCRLRREEN